MTLKKLVQDLRSAAPSGLLSVILYGSAAAGDHVGNRSDYNILVVMEHLGLKELKAFSKTSSAWVKKGNPPPLFFTLERLKNSADVFPIELLDMKESHKVLFGENVLQEVEVCLDNLRLQLEHELKSKLIQLREGFLAVGGKPKHVLELMIKSLSNFLVLFRAALRLYQDAVPPTKMEALHALSERIEFDIEVFETIEELKEGRKKPRHVDPDDLFEKYLRTVEAVVDTIDAHMMNIRRKDV